MGRGGWRGLAGAVVSPSREDKVSSVETREASWMLGPDPISDVSHFI